MMTVLTFNECMDTANFFIIDSYTPCKYKTLLLLIPVMKVATTLCFVLMNLADSWNSLTEISKLL